ncbi:MAG TPA: molybdenum cofactor biosynthesis protein MoaE, partial [Segetibacter sp.]
MLITIVDNIDLNKAYSFLETPDAGAVNLFVGTVRNQTKGKEVLKLVFEAYETMALKEMTLIAEEAKKKWPLTKVLMV